MLPQWHGKVILFKKATNIKNNIFSLFFCFFLATGIVMDLSNVSYLDRVILANSTEYKYGLNHDYQVQNELMKVKWNCTIYKTAI